MIKPLKEPKVTERSTKQDILKAYQTLLEEVAEESAPSLESREAGRVVESASKETIEKITADLGKLKLSTSQTITTLTEQLTEEAEKLSSIKKAIALSQKELEDTHKIKLTADAIYNMIERHKQEEETFTKTMEAQRALWEEERKQYEEQIKKNRTREEEEYAYQKNLMKARDQEAWNEEKQKREQEKEARKKEEAAKQEELERLEKQVAGFPLELEKGIKIAVVQAEAVLKKESDTQAAFARQEAQNTINLKNATIASLEEMVKTQTAEIKELKHQLEEATRHVKDIAVAVVEGKKPTPPQSS